jgi:hypothetical protein
LRVGGYGDIFEGPVDHLFDAIFAKPANNTCHEDLFYLFKKSDSPNLSLISGFLKVRDLLLVDIVPAVRCECQFFE